MEKQESEGKLADQEQDDSVEKGSDGDVLVECIHCGNQPCVAIELEPMLLSILETYQDIKTKRQIRFQMYTDTIRYIHGPELGKGVRKSPQAVL